MAEMKQLAKETAVYGVSSIVGKFLNWLLVPLYSYVLASSADYGIVTHIYAWVALVIVVLTYGMETGYFRFASEKTDDESQANRVYSTTLCSLAFTSLLFSILIVLFRDDVASALGYGSHAEFIALMGICVALDAFDSIPFAYLRYKKRAAKFAIFKLLMVVVDIFFNIFFLVLCPLILESSFDWMVNWFFDPDYGVGYVFVANIIGSSFVTLLLMPTILEAKFDFDAALLRKMLKYSMPILLLGIVGIMNQTVDKILFPEIYPDKNIVMSELGIYGACFKVAMVMMVFTNAFRYAYEPFVFHKYGTRDCKESYSDAMKYFVIASLIIFLGMSFYMDILQYILDEQYRVGLKVVPFVLISYIFQGVVYNLSLWYKVVDKTYWGAIFSVIGLLVNLVLQIWLIPIWSYWACVWAAMACYFVMMVMSYFIGQRYYPISYQLGRIGLYVLLAAALWVVGCCFVEVDNFVLRMVFRTVLLAIFCVFVIKLDLPLSEIPLLNRLVRNK